MSLGRSEDEFWEKTPSQVFRAMRAEEVRMRREHNDRVRLAWTTAWLTRTNKPPESLDQLLVPESGGKPKKQRQSIGDMKFAAMMLTAVNGGKIGPKVRLN